MTAGGRPKFTEMAREFPVRTAVFTLVPLVFAIVQFANSVLYDGAVLFTALFSAVVLGYAVLVTRYHLAAFHRARVSTLTSR